MPFYPSFPTYLLPSLPFSTSSRRGHLPTSRTRSECSENAVPSLSSSPTSSDSAAPSPSPPTSPPLQHRTALSHKFTGLLHAALQTHQSPQTRKPERLSRAQPNTLKCITCSTDVAFASQIVSKGFTGRHGRAYLVSPPPRPPLSDRRGKKHSKPTDLVNIKVGRAVNRELLTGAHVVADVSCLICQTVLGWKYVDAKEPGQRYKIGKYILETKRVVGVVSWEDGIELDEGEPAGLADTDNDGVVIFDEEDEDECEDLFAGVWDPVTVAKRRARRVNTRTTDTNN